MTELAPTITIPALILVAVAAAIDWRVQRVPNVLTFGGAAFGALLQFVVNGPGGLVTAALGLFVCMACFMPFYVMRGMAAGDVKLMAAVGAFVGPLVGLVACLYTMLVGALIGIAYICFALPAVVDASSMQQREGHRGGLTQRIPYAGAIAAGSLLAMLQPYLLLGNLISGRAL